MSEKLVTNSIPTKNPKPNKNKERRSDVDDPLQDLLELVERSVVDRSVGTAT